MSWEELGEKVSEESSWFLNEEKYILDWAAEVLHNASSSFCGSHATCGKWYLLELARTLWNPEAKNWSWEDLLADLFPTCSESSFWILHHTCSVKSRAAVSLVHPITSFENNTSQLNIATKRQKATLFFWWKTLNILSSPLKHWNLRELIFSGNKQLC